MRQARPQLRIGVSGAVTRRALLGGAAGASALAMLGARSGFARQTTPTAFDREASITSWGFGVEETNPMAFSRVEALPVHSARGCA